MKTKATKELPEINWERGQFIEKVDHDTEYCAYGESEDERKWSGTWCECDGHFIEILNIEEIIQDEGDNDPHEVSIVKCDLCGYEWVAVRPAGLIKLECPNCGNVVYFENL